MTTIYITDTRETADIVLIDQKSGQDWSRDWIGNTAHGMSTIAPDGVDADADYYADSEQTKWWVDLADKQQAADDRLYAARQACDDAQLAELKSACTAEGILIWRMCLAISINASTQ